MSVEKSGKNKKQLELLHSRKILPEVEQRMKKGEGIDVIIGKADAIYIDPDTGKEVEIEELKKRKLDPDKCKKIITIDSIKKQLEERLEKKGIKDVKIETTDFYIALKLDPETIREIAGEVKDKEGIEGIHRIWIKRKTSAFLDTSNNTINSTAAINVFSVKGEGIVWAVIDTGITLNNPLINEAILERFDFTGEGDGDNNGHGTHVAGIIASRSKTYPGIARDAKLYDFKVLDTNGSGNEFDVIKAMETIRKINEKKGEIIIHGVNISLGSPPEVGSYGVGSSPVCQEANRLVDSGVVVCVAAGNDGYKILAAFSSSTQVDYFKTFMDLSVSDPGNAEKVITVGSVHKSKPHTYGISYFSARGPTGDGRFKPDVVAPGEKIKSLGLKEKEDGIEMSGTSMAAPHVSGAIALFLSAKREFIGHPQKVKETLMQNCTDLKRDRNFQGMGLINILRTIQAV